MVQTTSSPEGRHPEAAAPRRRRIDCHLHYYASAFADRLLARAGPADPNTPFRGFATTRAGWRDLGDLRRVLDQTEVELGVILPNPFVLAVLREAGAGATEAYNRSMSDDLASGAGRFIAAAVVDPFGGTDEVARLDRALSLPHVGAVGLLASYDGVALDDAAFGPIFEVARTHDAPVLVHPSAVTQSWKEALRLDDNVLEAGLGFLLDDALCILRMALHGTFDHFPGVRFMFCQLGGFAPACCARWAFDCRQRQLLSTATCAPLSVWATHTLTEYLSRVWLDTHSQDRHMLRLVLDLAGDRGIVLCGDYPLTVPEDGVLHAMAEVPAMGPSDEIVRKIERENA